MCQILCTQYIKMSKTLSLLKPKFQSGSSSLIWRTNSLEKTLILGKTGQKEKGVKEGKMVGWHNQLNSHEFEQTPGDNEGQGSLERCSPWGQRVTHDLATEQHVDDPLSTGMIKECACKAGLCDGRGWGAEWHPPLSFLCHPNPPQTQVTPSSTSTPSDHISTTL